MMSHIHSSSVHPPAPLCNPSLRDNDMRRRQQDCYGGQDGEQGEGDQTEPIQDHGSEFPVILDGRRVLVVSDLVRDDSDFLED